MRWLRNIDRRLRVLYGELEDNVLIGDLLINRREGVQLCLHIHLKHKIQR